MSNTTDNKSFTSNSEITALVTRYLDPHMIIPMLDFLRDPKSVLRDEKSTEADKVSLLTAIKY